MAYTYKSIDLFAGIGGIRLGFEQAFGNEMETVFVSEWNKFSNQTYLANFDDPFPINGDITQVPSDEVPDHDILLAGFPCQPFSIAGVSKKNSLGRATGFADETQGTLFFDMAKQDWDPEFVRMAGLRPDQLPRLLEPTDLAGRVTAEAAAATGLPAGTPVACGTSDSAVEDYGAGAVEPGDLILKLATAGNVNSMTAEPHPHPKTLTYGHVVPGMWYSVSATNAAALCMRWLRDTFFEVKSADASSAYGRIDAEAAASPVGANGVTFHPYLQGERCPYWDSNLRASFTGVSISSTRGDFCRALMEGVAFSLRDCYRTLEEMDLQVKRIFLIGGGARSALWSEIVCNVFDRPVAVPSPGDASFGAALLAGVGTGVFRDAKDAVARCLRIDRRLEPDPATAATYADLFARYRAIHDALAPIYARG